MVNDAWGRPLKSLRISVTDRCNLRCRYCMPEDEYAWLPRETILSFEEIERVTQLATRLGIDKLRLTGGEPLLRRDLPDLVRRLARLDGVRDLALTTNAVLLARHASALRAAGLQRVTISLDTLRPERFRGFTKSDRHPDVLRGIEAARATGLGPLKVNTVVIRGFNDDELVELIEFGRGLGAEVRFIEYMDVGGATRWSMDAVVSRREILDRLTRRYGSIEPLPSRDSAPADRFRLPDGVVFGIIASTTAPFCRTCDRARLTADGTWFQCLYARQGLDLKARLRDGSSDDAMLTELRASWQSRVDRGAEERVGRESRGPLYQIGSLRRDPHLEMHTRGG